MDGAALEALVAAAVDQAAGFHAGRVAEFPFFEAQAAPCGPNGTPRGEGAGGG